MSKNEFLALAVILSALTIISGFALVDILSEIPPAPLPAGSPPELTDLPLGLDGWKPPKGQIVSQTQADGLSEGGGLIPHYPPTVVLQVGWEEQELRSLSSSDKQFGGAWSGRSAVLHITSEGLPLQECNGIPGGNPAFFTHDADFGEKKYVGVALYPKYLCISPHMTGNLCIDSMFVKRYVEITAKMEIGFPAPAPQSGRWVTETATVEHSCGRFFVVSPTDYAWREHFDRWSSNRAVLPWLVAFLIVSIGLAILSWLAFAKRARKSALVSGARDS